MQAFIKSYKIITSVAFAAFLSVSNLYAQTTVKPKLDFEAHLNANNNQLEITWAECLENSIVTLMDKEKNPIQTHSLCRNNDIIDLSKLNEEVTFIKVEHYTGVGIKAIQLKEDESKE